MRSLCGVILGMRSFLCQFSHILDFGYIYIYIYINRMFLLLF